MAGPSPPLLSPCGPAFFLICTGKVMGLGSQGSAVDVQKQECLA